MTKARDRQKAKRDERRKEDAARGYDGKIGRRPLLLDEETSTKLAALLRSGAYVEQAAAQVGIGKATFYDWLGRGARERKRRAAIGDVVDVSPNRKREQVFVDFIDAIERAQAEGEHAMLAAVSRCAIGGAVVSRTTTTDAAGVTTTTERLADPDWRAAAWRLERRSPERWGRRDATTVLDVTNAGSESNGENAEAQRARMRLIATLRNISMATEDTSERAARIDTEDSANEDSIA